MKLGGIQSSTCERNLYLFFSYFEKSYIDLDLFIYQWGFREAYPEFSETLNSNKLNAATFTLQELQSFLTFAIYQKFLTLAL